MRVLVTGAAGFIGWKVCEFLLADEHMVVGMDNLNDAYDVRPKHWRLAQLEGNPGFEFHRLDICDRQSLRGFFEETVVSGSWSAVINLAPRAAVRQSVENPWVYFETNMTGTLNLLELCREFGVEKFVQASTSSLYGANNPRPFREDADTDGSLSPLRSLEESGRGAVLLVPLPLRLGRDGAALLNRLRPGGAAGHEPVSFCTAV